MSRQFEAKPAVRERVPVLVGLMGPSGSGKTFSALRLATGIREVTGGDIYVLDTEARRSLHYSDMFEFKHVQFDAPFGSGDYLDALRYAVGKGAGVVVIDSLSHEHEGPGGLLDAYERELDRLAGQDWQKRERMKMLAWQKPKAARRELINALLQLNANFVFCFRAKETVKPVKVGGKTEIQPQGFLPIAGPEFLFEMTVNCLLLPKSGGVPTWRSDLVGERLMMKLPKQFEGIFAKEQPLSEPIGMQLAEWARGGATTPRKEVVSHEVTQTHSISQGRERQPPSAQSDTEVDDFDTERAMQYDEQLAAAAEQGLTALQAVWTSIPAEYRSTLKSAKDRRHKPRAVAVDQTVVSSSHAELEPPS